MPFGDVAVIDVIVARNVATSILYEDVRGCGGVKLGDQMEDVRSKVRQGIGFNLWVVPLS